MNAIISLCHFCEVHGPSILFCTQAFHSQDPALDEGVGAGIADDVSDAVPERSTAKGENSVAMKPTTVKAADLCEACRSLSLGQPGFIGVDREANVNYVSSQHPRHPQVFSMVRQACVRSLSCEVCPGREGPIFFGDDHRGHVISHTFYIKDSQARGFQRWYSIIVVMMDKIFLLNSWPFLVEHIRSVIDDLQGRANVVYEKEHAKCPPRAHRLNMSMNPSNFLQHRGGGASKKPARSLVELTNDKNIFRKLHQDFTWILKAGGSRLTERLLEGPPTEDSIIDLEQQEETEEGFVNLFSKKDVVEEQIEEGGACTEEEDDSNIPTFKSLRHLMKVLGMERFHQLAYHVVIGNQVIVKGHQKVLVKSVIDCLKNMLPRGCCKVIYFSDKYEDSWRCNFLGLPPTVQPPSDAEHYLVLNIQSPPTPDEMVPPPMEQFEGYIFDLDSKIPLPDKSPMVLDKMEFVLKNSDLPESVVEQWFVCLKEEWMNKVKVLFKFTKAGGNRSEEDTKKLLQVVGAQNEDKAVLKFWMTGLSVQYRNHMLSSAIHQSMVS